MYKAPQSLVHLFMRTFGLQTEHIKWPLLQLYISTGGHISFLQPGQIGITEGGGAEGAEGRDDASPFSS